MQSLGVRIREASDTKTFIGPYRHDSVDNYFPDIEKGIATIIEWEPSYHNETYKYIVNEDKTFEELEDHFRMITGEPIRMNVSSNNRCTYSASELKSIIKNNKYELVPYIYLIKDGLVYSLVNYYLDHAELGDFFRFACLTLNSVIYGEISGDSNEVTFTEKLFS